MRSNGKISVTLSTAVHRLPENITVVVDHKVSLMIIKMTAIVMFIVANYPATNLLLYSDGAG